MGVGEPAIAVRGRKVRIEAGRGGEFRHGLVGAAIDRVHVAKGDMRPRVLVVDADGPHCQSFSASAHRLQVAPSHVSREQERKRQHAVGGTVFRKFFRGRL